MQEDAGHIEVVLTDSEIRKYRWLGKHATEAVIAVCRRLQPGISEREMEAMASDELMRRGIRPTVLLMGVDDRVFHFRHTTPSGARAGGLIGKAKGWFAENGFAGELEKHHQGGAIGYAEREWIAAPGSPEVIHERQALAWNPIVQGALSFDTYIVFKDHVENLDAVPGWPVIDVEVDGVHFRLPGILVR